MQELPVSVRRALHRLTRRLAIGLFLEIWPAWAVGGLLLAGTLVLIARLFIPQLGSVLPWLWLAPLIARCRRCFSVSDAGIGRRMCSPSPMPLPVVMACCSR
jgi:hypothetical protein